LVNGRTYVTEDDVQKITYPVLNHRLIYRNKEARQKALTGILNKEMDRLSKLKISN
jgi:MoxR-like ATPase